MSSFETGQMSAAETGQMASVEIGQISAIPPEKMCLVETGPIFC